jgi:hypothetical protein
MQGHGDRVGFILGSTVLLTSQKKFADPFGQPSFLTCVLDPIPMIQSWLMSFMCSVVGSVMAVRGNLLVQSPLNSLLMNTLVEETM